jgi:hypothetical protein
MGDNGLELFLGMLIKQIRKDKDITLEEQEMENDYWADAQAEQTEAMIWNG